MAWKSILRFMSKKRIISLKVPEGFTSEILSERNMLTVKSERGGILYRKRLSGDEVKRGEQLAKILDPYDGAVLSRVVAPAAGRIFFCLRNPLVSANTVIYRLIKY